MGVKIGFRNSVKFSKKTLVFLCCIIHWLPHLKKASPPFKKFPMIKFTKKVNFKFLEALVLSSRLPIKYLLLSQIICNLKNCLP